MWGCVYNGKRLCVYGREEALIILLWRAGGLGFCQYDI